MFIPLHGFKLKAKELIAKSPEAVTHLSEIPCRVSSDLHEWRNDLRTVLTCRPANLWSR